MFTTTDSSDWQLMHVLRKNTYKFATLPRSVGSAHTAVVAKLAYFDRSEALLMYGPPPGSKVHQFAGLRRKHKYLHPVQNHF